jgi:glycosyltransferase involved in cell wall biosynthesis
LPAAPIVNLFDYYYDPHANDLAPELGRRMPLEYFQWRRSANVMDLLDLENGAAAWTTTEWQRDLYPPEYRDEFTVIFDGVEPRFRRGTPRAARTIAGRAIPGDAKLVTFVARELDTLRGFDRFVQLANRLLRRSADVICVAAGGAPVRRTLDVEFYGKDFGAHLLAQTPPYDPARFWSLGQVAPAVVSEMLAATDLHVYPSRPYVVSRSLVEAMASEAVIMAWDTEPAREFLKADETAILVSPDDPDEQERRAWLALENPASHRPLADRARALAAERYARDTVVPQLAAWFDRLVFERR